jgi:Metallo-peptidase family M12B Reprolysin-like/Secretion system C-terminal sorting domain
LIKIGEISTAQSGGKLEVRIPGEPGIFTMKVERAEYKDQNNYLWQGTRIINDSVKSPEYILLIKENGRLFGDLTVNGNHYTIFSLSSNYQTLIKGKKTGNTIDMNSPGGISNEEECVMGTEQCFVDILIVYTPELYAIYPGFIGQLSRICMEQLNTAFKRSGMKIKGRLAGIEQWQGIALNYTSATLESAYVESQLELPNSTVTQQRNAVDADLVVVLTSGQNYPASGPVLGHANGIPATTPSNGSAVVMGPLAVSEAYVFAHEVGHLLGGRHQDDTTDSPALAHEFDATLGGVTRHYLTIMHKDITQILNYSNPDIKYIGQPTGTATRNNACKMQSYGCPVSNIVVSDICRVRATGTFNCHARTITINAQLKQENGTPCPVSYWQFDYSFDGTSFVNGAPTPIGSAVVTYPACTETTFIRIKAFDVASNLISTTFELYNLPLNCQCAVPYEDGGGIPRPLVNNDEAQSTLASAKVSIAPNPTNNQFELQIEADAPDEISLEIFNQQGVQVLSLPLMEVRKGIQLLAVDVANLPAGMYSVRGVGKVYSFVRQFVKL